MNSGEEILHIFGLFEMNSIVVSKNLDTKEVAQGTKIFHGKIKPQSSD
jgi:hypothetical protein